MEQTTPDGLVSPSGGEEYALSPAMAALAESVQKALTKRANTRKGTQTERTSQTSSLPDGTLWKDTTGDRALWVLDAGQWKQLWPQPLSRAIYGGSSTTKLGIPFLNLRWLTDDNQVYHTTLRPGTDPETVAASLLGMTGNNIDVAMHLYRSGQITVFDGSQARSLPFASANGYFTSTVTGPDNVNIINVSFPTGRFTAAPGVQVTLGTDFPQGYSYSITGVTTSGFKLHVHRQQSGSFNLGIHWTATQLNAVV